VVTGLTDQSVGPVHMLHTGLTGGIDRSDQSGLSCCSCLVSSGVLHAFVQGELHWFRGELACVQGKLFVVFRALVWWLALFV
jgi:LytS/YehU family sensor histidine kinase